MHNAIPTRPRAGESRTVAIAGANGMVGHRLVEALQASGDRVIALVRQPSAHHFPSAVETRRWQASDPVAPLDGAHAVVNLVGDPIFAKPWSRARKQELTQTRLLATRSLVEGIRKIGEEGFAARRLRANASAIDRKSKLPVRVRGRTPAGV